MFLKLTGIYGELVVINSDKIISFQRAEHGTSKILENCTSKILENCTEVYFDGKRSMIVIEDFDFIMNCLQN